MKIAILTQPLQTNYGGILQNFALQEVLKKEGHVPVTINIVRKNYVPYYRRCLSWIKRLTHYFILGHDVVSLNFDYRIPWQDLKLVSQNIDTFIASHIARTKRIDENIEITELDGDIDAYIVGSDQVWRPKYNPNIEECFLCFISDDSSVRRIVYAASFGTIDKEFSDKQLQLCRPLAQKMNAISVRERSAVMLCKEYFDVRAEHVLDPTMLLHPEEYLALLSDNKKLESDLLFCYILDPDNNKNEIIHHIETSTGLTSEHLMPRPYSVRAKTIITNCIFPSVEEWIQGFVKSPYIVTDSFHGTVFSILFNKPFITINNPSRGSDRFISLLDTFGLRHRMISSEAEITSDLLSEKIDWKVINTIMDGERKRSLRFLNDALNLN